MRITHICIAAPFSDGYSYQENLLAKYHVRLGYEVSVIASDIALNSNGEFHKVSNKTYTNEDGVKIHRIQYKNGQLAQKLKIVEDYSDLLNELSPNIIFIHGCQFMSNKQILNYKKENPHVRIFIDNHADFSNSATNFISHHILHRIIWKSQAKKFINATEKFFGVLPARMDFLNDVYGIPKEIIDYLPLGGDDDFVNSAIETKRLRKHDDKIRLVTGGKIDHSKREVLYLMDYVGRNKNLSLTIFGSVIPEYEEEFNSLLTDNIEYIGWINNEESYRLFNMADLIIFPGRHSVYWEQVVSQKKPLIVKKWEGTQHIDIGGNVIFIDYNQTEASDSGQAIFDVLDKVFAEDTLSLMTKAASNPLSEQFLYSNIARKSIELGD